MLVTHMGSNVSSLVELISRHTTLKLAGIDKPVPVNNLDSLAFYRQLKHDADLIIISVHHLLEWLALELLTHADISLIVFDHVTAAFHMRDAYERVITTRVGQQQRLVGFGSLDIDTLDVDVDAVREHVESLKRMFACDRVETATDLLDTSNIFNGYEPTEVIEICDDAVSVAQIHDFNLKLVHKIKSVFVLFERLIISNTDHSTAYIHQLCLRVLNECVYLLNEVGVWCLAKSLLPFICQIDKLAAYIEANDDTESQASSSHELHNDAETSMSMSMRSLDGRHYHAQQQILTLQTSATLLRELREMCIKQILHSKSTSHRNASFLVNFTTPKVQRLVQLLKSYKNEAFCCLIFVQNKQVVFIFLFLHNLII